MKRAVIILLLSFLIVAVGTPTPSLPLYVKKRCVQIHGLSKSVHDIPFKLKSAAIVVSAMYGYSPKLIIAMAWVESRYYKYAKSSEKCYGYLQVSPRWHAEKIANRDIYDACVQVDVSCKILDEYKYKKNPMKALYLYSGRDSTYYKNVKKIKDLL